MIYGQYFIFSVNLFMEHFMPQHPSWTQCWRDQQDQDILDAAGQRDGGAEWKLHLPSQEPVRGEWIQDN